MSEMSAAIRVVVERHAQRPQVIGASATLSQLTDDTLKDFVQIVGAFYLDLKDELQRRQRRGV